MSARPTAPGGPDGAAAPVQSAEIKGIARGGSANLVGAVVNGVSQFGVTWLIARSLPQNEAGAFFSISSLFLVAVVVANLGANVGLVYFLSRARAVGGRSAFRAIIRTGLQPVVAVSVLLALVLFVFAPQIAGTLVPSERDYGTVLLRVLACVLPFGSLENVSLAGTRGFAVMRPGVLIANIGRPLLQILLVFGFVVIGAAEQLHWGWAAVYVPSALAAVLALRRRVRGAGGREDAPAAPSHGAKSDEEQVRPVPSGREFWRFSGTRAAMSIIMIAMQRMDIVLVGALAGTRDAAIYAAATRFVVIAQMVSTALGNATDPRIAALMAKHDRDGVREIYRTATSWLVMIVWPAMILLVVFAEPVLSIFGASYVSGASTLQVLCLAMVFSAACGMVDSVLVMSGRPAISLVNAVVAATVMFTADWLLVPGMGVFGAAIGWALAIVVRNVLGVVQVYRAEQLHPFSLRGAAVMAIAGLVWVAVAWGARAVLGTTFVAFLAAAGVGVAVYGALVLGQRRVFGLDGLGALRRGRIAKQEPARG